MSWRLLRLERTAVARGYGGQRAEVPAFIAGKAHYYPFGMNHLGPCFVRRSPEGRRRGMRRWRRPKRSEGPERSFGKNKYLYNGKELSEDYGIKLMDYGARWYDGGIGRWTAADPMADIEPSWMPFRYAFNNPAFPTPPHSLLGTRSRSPGRSLWLGGMPLSMMRAGSVAPGIFL
ncbi:MAG: hypothetical protein J5I98_33315 [Phaeodactylibacter sp.]|nr:hypothetical protein [Phaeodactylibacter sp.]